MWLKKNKNKNKSTKKACRLLKVEIWKATLTYSPRTSHPRPLPDAGEFPCVVEPLGIRIDPRLEQKKKIAEVCVLQRTYKEI